MSSGPSCIRLLRSSKLSTPLIAGLFLTVNSRGIGVGSKLDFEALNKFIEGEKMGLDKVIDNVYVFDNTLAAFERLASGEHAGKVVIKLG